MQAKKGKFIVIDGTNGSGKATQTEKLVKVLKKQKKNILFVDFPQYGKRSATLVEDYLNGKFGSAEEVGPYRASILFACDRYAASKKIQQHLDNGEIVISNRYTPSNMAHQTAQITKKADKEKYLEMQKNIKILSSKYNVKYFNYFFDERFTDVDFVNSDHLDAYGAEKFTKILEEVL